MKTVYYKEDPTKKPATAKQINTIVSFSHQYKFTGIGYPKGPMLSKAAASGIIDRMTKTCAETPKRHIPQRADFQYPNSEDVDYASYDAALTAYKTLRWNILNWLADRYPDNKIQVESDDYYEASMDSEASLPTKPSGLADPKDVKHRAAERSFNAAVTRSFMKID